MHFIATFASCRKPFATISSIGMNKNVYIAVSSDHAGFELKAEILTWLKAQSYKNVTDLGAYNNDSVDYPDFGAKMGEVITLGKAEIGIVVCGSGIGISIAANRFPAVRCALCHSAGTAKLGRAHNDANVLAMGSRIIDVPTAIETLEAFLTTDFDGGDRHIRRRNKLGEIT